MLIFDQDHALARWAGARLGIADFSPCATIGVAHNGEIVAVAIYNKLSAAQHRDYVRLFVAALGQQGGGERDPALSVRAAAVRARDGGDAVAERAGAGLPVPARLSPGGRAPGRAAERRRGELWVVGAGCDALDCLIRDHGLRLLRRWHQAICKQLLLGIGPNLT
jgi:hypothetical protein